MNKWIIAMVYSSLLTTLCYLSIKALIFSAINTASFPNALFFIAILEMIFGVWILAFGIKKYISNENKKDRRKLKIMFSIISVLSCYIDIILFFV
ncbi:hypothetical protein CON65_23385 [Bacillus pseudomycoides]|uniref:Uncharacterized protein n=1 Tax=Bacillus pseudomycoides TaxID=64104 RepID=A0AA91V977_9BACI|nr:hypothetical protein COO03_01695 [Bacillus sp. AFS098217]PED80285.1 hypothetical protein CON65_23385 [Bacillus pseudomycoides]PEU10177.1 hypothetical protein CN525_23960 [Bacillus sp. AFS014408]PEU18008.1 hypothetical protein CN524_00385 [Bacillus sp. AFS019443]PFW61225.1 hypothetical protein COL20_18585 [Bacillus sp. AFS075034]